MSDRPEVDDEEMMTVAEAATLARCSQATIRRAIARGDLAAMRLGTGSRTVRIPRHALRERATSTAAEDREVRG